MCLLATWTMDNKFYAVELITFLKNKARALSFGKTRKEGLQTTGTTT
jgi:hypothetical protein